MKEHHRNRYRNLPEEKKNKIREYSRNRYRTITKPLLDMHFHRNIKVT